MKIEIEIFKFSEKMPEDDRDILTFDYTGKLITGYMNCLKVHYWAYAPKLDLEDKDKE